MCTHRPSFIRYGLVFALVAALLALHPLAFHSYLRLFYPEAGMLIQPTPEEGVPTPRALAWNDFTYNLIGYVARLTSAAVLGIEIGLFCVLIYAVLRIVNPTFRLTTGVNWDREILTHTYMHTPPLIKAFLIAVTATVPLIVAWYLVSFVLRGHAATLWVWTALAGGAFMLLFSRNGVAGDFDSGNYELPRQKDELQSLLARGAVLGLIAALIFHLASYAAPEPLLFFFRSLSAIGEKQWWTIAAISLGISAVLGVAGAGFVIALGTPGMNWHKRARASLFPLFALLLVFLFGRWIMPAVMLHRYDYEPGGGPTLVDRLAKAAGIRKGASEGYTFLLLGRERSISLNVSVQSFLGLDASEEASRKIEKFLKRRGYRTALADPAFKTMHDSASLRWDSAESLRVDLENLIHCPDPIYIGLLIAKLRTTASTPETRRYADLLANESHFVFPDRMAIQAMGDIYASLGMRDKAEKWYRRSGVPESQLERVLSERTMFNQGKISGRIMLNGKPVQGAKVGLVPAAVVRELFQTMLGPGFVRPFWLRWVSATALTDAEGRFTLSQLVAGRYRMLVMIPQLRLPSFSRELSVQNAPQIVFTEYGTPSSDVGTISIRAPMPPLPQRTIPRSDAEFL